MRSSGECSMRFRTQTLAASTPLVTGRRTFLKTITASSIALAASGAAFVAQHAAAEGGQMGYIAVQGAELFVHPNDLSAILYMDEGSAVDILFGPYQGLYQVRYYGTDGWVWAEYLSLDGSTAPAGNFGGASEEAPVTEDVPPVATSPDEHWIDVNRTSGLVRLMIGDESIAAFWGSLGYDSADYGFYATALGTFYVYGFEAPLHFTDFANAYISDWVAFDPERYNGFHSYSKDKNGNVLPNGAGRTGGCVALAPGDIDQLFDFAQMSMRVEVHW